MNDSNNNGMNSFWAGLVGGVIGAGAVLFSDESFRNTIRKKLSTLMGEIEEKKEEGREKIETEIKKTRNKIARVQSDLTK